MEHQGCRRFAGGRGVLITKPQPYSLPKSILKSSPKTLHAVVVYNACLPCRKRLVFISLGVLLRSSQLLVGFQEIFKNCKFRSEISMTVNCRLLLPENSVTIDELRIQITTPLIYILLPENPVTSCEFWRWITAPEGYVPLSKPP